MKQAKRTSESAHVSMKCFAPAASRLSQVEPSAKVSSDPSSNFAEQSALLHANAARYGQLLSSLTQLRGEGKTSLSLERLMELETRATSGYEQARSALNSSL